MRDSEVPVNPAIKLFPSQLTVKKWTKTRRPFLCGHFVYSPRFSRQRKVKLKMPRNHSAATVLSLSVLMPIHRTPTRFWVPDKNKQNTWISPDCCVSHCFTQIIKKNLLQSSAPPKLDANSRNEFHMHILETLLLKKVFSKKQRAEHCALIFTSR